MDRKKSMVMLGIILSLATWATFAVPDEPLANHDVHGRAQRDTNPIPAPP